MKKTACIRTIIGLLAVLLLLSGCSDQTDPITTTPAASAPPITAPPSTNVPSTTPPTAAPPSTNVPSTTPPTTAPPSTNVPDPALIGHTWNAALATPDVYKIDTKPDAETAAKQLLDQMFAALQQPDDRRTFRFLAVRDVVIEVHPSEDVRRFPDTETDFHDWGVEPDDPLIGPDTWLVYVEASFRFEGIYASIGRAQDASTWYAPLRQGSRWPMIMTETESGYTLRSLHPVKMYTWNAALATPDVYKIDTKPDAETAAKQLLDQMFAALQQPDDRRTFRFLAVRDVVIEVHPSEDVRRFPDTETDFHDWGVEPDDPLIGPDTWLVYVEASFRFEGIYMPIGQALDASTWYAPLRQGGRWPMIMTKTESGYTLRSLHPAKISP